MVAADSEELLLALDRFHSRQGRGVTKDSDKTSSGRGPVKIIQDSLKPELPKRFYKDASVEERSGGFRIVLDGRGVKTPKKRDLELTTRALAQAIAHEWAAQGERIDPATMPLTGIANSAIDAVADRLAEVAADIRAFAGNDLICYRARRAGGADREAECSLEPDSNLGEEALGADFLVGEGVIPIEQPSRRGCRRWRRARRRRSLSAHSACMSATTLTGSARLRPGACPGRLTLDRGLGRRPCGRGVASRAVGLGCGGAGARARPQAGVLSSKPHAGAE